MTMVSFTPHKKTNFDAYIDINKVCKYLEGKPGSRLYDFVKGRYLKKIIPYYTNSETADEVRTNIGNALTTHINNNPTLQCKLNTYEVGTAIQATLNKVVSQMEALTIFGDVHDADILGENVLRLAIERDNHLNNIETMLGSIGINTSEWKKQESSTRFNSIKDAAYTVEDKLSKGSIDKIIQEWDKAVLYDTLRNNAALQRYRK